jgi:hypothetical protein
MMTATMRISVPEAAAMTQQHPSIIEGAMQRGELRFVLSGASRRVRTTPEWVGRWVEAGRGR